MAEYKGILHVSASCDNETLPYTSFSSCRLFQEFIKLL